MLLYYSFNVIVHVYAFTKKKKRFESNKNDYMERISAEVKASLDRVYEDTTNTSSVNDNKRFFEIYISIRNNNFIWNKIVLFLLSVY